MASVAHHDQKAQDQKGHGIRQQMGKTTVEKRGEQDTAQAGQLSGDNAQLIERSAEEQAVDDFN